MKITILQLRLFTFEDFSSQLFLYAAMLLIYWLFVLIMNIFFFKTSANESKKSMFLLNQAIGLPVIIFSVCALISPEIIASYFVNNFNGALNEFHYKLYSFIGLVIYTVSLFKGLGLYTKISS